MEESGSSSNRQTIKVNKNTWNLQAPIKDIISVVQNYEDFQPTDQTKGYSYFNYSLEPINNETCSDSESNTCTDTDTTTTNDQIFNFIINFNGEDNTNLDVPDDNSTLFVGNSKFLRIIQPQKYGKFIPSTNIYSYSFAQKPLSLTPTGSVNFSRIKDIEFKYILYKSCNRRRITTYLLSSNVLTISCGVANLKYAYH